MYWKDVAIWSNLQYRVFLSTFEYFFDYLKYSVEYVEKT